MKPCDIVLFNTPYSSMGNPYISVPLLHSYLKNQDIDVKSFDLDAHLYMGLSRPENVRKGVEHLKKRFKELNGRDSLSFAESAEYKMFSTLLFQLSLHGDHIDDFLSKDYDFEDFKNVSFKKLLISAASALSFPEMIVTVPQFAVNPLYESFSVAEIFKSFSDRNHILEILYSKIDTILDEYHSPIWGFSIPFNDQIIKTFQCAAYIKKKRPDAFIIFGGPAVSMYFKHFPDLRLFSIVDAFAYYEGELTLKSLVDVVKKKESLHDVPGISFMDNGSIFYTDPPEKIPLNESVLPDYSAFDLDSYVKGRDSMTVPIRLTKGCSWGKCTFCSSFSSEYELMDPEKAFEHLFSVYRETGIKHFMFSDESSPLNSLDYISEKIIENDLTVSWIFHTRLSRMLTKKRFELYKRAGCQKINIGIESTSDRILKKMNKGITFSQIKEFFDGMEKVVPIGAYMMIGFPGELEDEAEAGYSYLSGLIEERKLISYQYSQFVIKPGSPIWEKPCSFGISEINKRKDLDLDHNVYSFQSDGMTLERVYELFSKYSGKTGLENAVSKIRRVDFQDLNESLNFNMKDINDFISSDLSFFYTSMSDWFSNPKRISKKEDFIW